MVTIKFHCKSYTPSMSSEKFKLQYSVKMFNFLKRLLYFQNKQMF